MATLEDIRRERRRREESGGGEEAPDRVRRVREAARSNQAVVESGKRAAGMAGRVGLDIASPTPIQAARPERQPQSDVERVRAARESQTPPLLRSLQRFGSQFLRGVTDAAAPAARLTPGGAARSVMGLTPSAEDVARSSSLIADEDPETLSGRAGRFSGMASTFAVPGGGAAGTVSRSAATGGRALTRLARGARNLVSDAGRTFRDKPIRTTAAEAGLGATAGAGGFVAEQKFPGSDAARVIGEVVGGVSPALLPTRLATRGGQKIAEKVRHPFTESGGRGRAARRFERATPGGRGQAGQALDQPTTIDPEAGLPVLTPAQRTGDPGLLSIERSVMEETESLQRVSDEQIARANQVLQQRLRGEGDPSQTAATLADAQGRLGSALNTRLRVAARKADERIEGLQAKASREQANRVAREEIEKAFADARAQEKALFKAIPEKAPVPTTRGREAFVRAVSETGKAQRGDIPGVARRLLGPGGLGETTTIKELRSLQSSLRETARRARAADRNNQARIAEDIADAVSEDIANAPGEAAQAAQTAVGFSREMRQNFKRGEVGRLMGRAPQGGASVAESLTLETALAGGGPRSREAFDQVVNALDNPSVIERTGGSSQRFREAAESFVTNQFLRSAAPEGQINPQRATTFLRQNGEILSRLPELRSQLEQAVQAGSLQALRQRQRARVDLSDPRRSKATLLIQKGPVEAFDAITRLKPGVALREAQKLLNSVKRDPSGEALAGLKGGFMDFLISGTREGQRDITGESFLSGFALRERLNDSSTQQVMRRLFDKGERERINQTARDLVRLERRRRAKPATEGVVGDQPGKLLNTIAGIAGAASGRRTAGNLGVGATVQIPGMVADRFRDLVRSRVRDPAGRLIRDAITDEGLFRELLQAEIQPDGTLPRTAQRRLNAWTAAILAEQSEYTE